jgi:hypothetical protein
MSRLIINPNTPSAWEVQLKPGANLLGRGFANDFKIENLSVSGSHCQIVLEGARVVIKDLGSTNGTFVNRAPVTEAILQPGQTIHLGSVEILFQGDAVPLARPAETEVIPRTAMPPPLAPALSVPAARAVTPVAVPSLQAAENIPVPPPPTAIPAAAPPRPPGITIAARPAAAPRPVPAALAPVAVPHVPHAPPAAPQMPSTGGHAVVGGGNCKFHPKTLGRYLCNTCNHYFCELCVASRTVGAEQHKFCRHCGAELEAVKVKVAYVAPKSFFSQLPGAFIFPVKGFGPLVIILSAILLLGLSFFTPGPTRFGYIPTTASWTLIFRLLYMGYLFAFMQSIIHSTAIGEDEMAGLPSLGNFWEDILLPGLQFLGLTLISFGPAIGVAAYMIFGPRGDEGTAILPYALLGAFVFGVLYFPMAFLAVAMLDSVMAANPIQIVPSIFKVPLEYFVTCLVLGLVVALPPIGDFLLDWMFPAGLHSRDMGMMFGYLASIIFWRLFGLYLLVVGVRILGLLFRCKREKLGWLE